MEGVEGVREGGGGGYLRHASPGLVGLLLVSPVASCKRVLQTVCDNPRLDGQLQIEVLRGEREMSRRITTAAEEGVVCTLTLPLSMNFWAYIRTSFVRFRNKLRVKRVDVNQKASWSREDTSSCLPSEEEGQKRSGKIQSLVAIVIPIIQLPPPQCSLQQPVNHVPGEEEEEEREREGGGEEERRVTHCRGQQVSVLPFSPRASPQEVSLLGLTEAADPNMRK